MTSVDVELVLVGLVAMLEPATLIFSALALAIGERPSRTGVWFYLGGLGATLAVGVLAAFLVGDVAASAGSQPKTWVAILNIVIGVALLVYVASTLRRPQDPQKMADNVARMQKLAAGSPTSILLAGAALANAGPFMLVALKDISQLDPTTLGYILDWLLFALASLLPLSVALLALRVAPAWTAPRLGAGRHWLERHARTIALVLAGALALTLLRDGIAGLVG
jgi:Sap-like sulfolipid-1-addressing protein